MTNILSYSDAISYDALSSSMNKCKRNVQWKDSVANYVLHSVKNNSSLAEELESWKGDNADLIARIEALEKENARYRQERTDAERMLEYERNKFERQMQSKEAGIAEQLAGDIELEIQAIRETTEYIDEDNQRRIRRRLQRIDDILQEFGGASDA